MSVRDQLVNFYLVHNPSNLQNIDRILEEFKGKEREMFVALNQKYNVRPETASSTPLTTTRTKATVEDDSLDGKSRTSQIKKLRDSHSRTASERAPSTERRTLRSNRQASRRRSESDEDVVERTLRTFRNQMEEIIDRAQQDMRKCARETLSIIRKEVSGGGFQKNDLKEVRQQRGGVDYHERVDQATATTECSTVASMIQSRLVDGVVTIPPGTYRENLTLTQAIEIRGEGSCLDEVVIESLNKSIPVVNVMGGNQVTLKNITLRQTAQSSASCISTSNTCDVRLENVEIQGGRCCISSQDESNTLLINCTIHEGSFAGVYAEEEAYIMLERCHVSGCGTGIRVRDATFLIRNTTVQRCQEDGIVLHGTTRGIIEYGFVQNNNGSGVVVGPRSEVLLSKNVVTENIKWGVECPISSFCTLKENEITRNQVGNFLEVENEA